MFARKFAIVGVVVALLGVTAAIAAAGGNDEVDGLDASELDTQAGVLLDASTGIAPIEEVVSFFQRRTDQRPDDFISLTALARALSDQARQTADLAIYGEAERHAREALAINPGYTAATIELASALHAQHRFTEARALGQELLNANPSSIDALYIVSDADFELGNYEVAAAAYERLEAAGRNAAVVSRLARLASARGDNEGAAALAAEARVLSGAFSLRPNAKAFYAFQHGNFLFEAGDVDAAITALNDALAIDPSHGGSIEKLASIRAAIGDTEGALLLYEQLIASGPAADLHGSYADLLRLAGADEAAAAQETLGLALAEETIEAYPAERRHTAGFYFSRDPRVALVLAEADIVERRDAGAYDTLAWAQHLNGHHEQAQVAIESALDIGINTAMVRYHAGAIAAALGQTDTAIEHLEAALSINDRFAFGDADDARQLLDVLRS